MIYLTVPPTVERAPTYWRHGLGIMATPNMGQAADSLRRAPVWAADNGCFTRGDDFNLDQYLDWLFERRTIVHRCLFATAPDVVGDAEATWERSKDVFAEIRMAGGYQAALVGQNGLLGHTPSWDDAAEWDVLFLGGDDEFKTGEEGRLCTARARELGKPVHMGRVNSWKRIHLADGWGCASADGTFVGFGPDENLPQVETWMTRLFVEPRLLEGVA